MKQITLTLFTLITLSACTSSKTVFHKKWTTKQAPENFVARFETTKGNIDIEVERKLSPKAVDRFYQLVKYNFFEDGTFYRVVPNFVAQFGNTDTIVSNQWKKFIVEDEPVIENPIEEKPEEVVGLSPEEDDGLTLVLFITFSFNE